MRQEILYGTPGDSKRPVRGKSPMRTALDSLKRLPAEVRHTCIYYARTDCCTSRVRPSCPWWHEGECRIEGKVGSKEEKNV